MPLYYMGPQGVTHNTHIIYYANKGLAIWQRRFITGHSGQNPSESQLFEIIQRFFDRRDPCVIRIRNFENSKYSEISEFWAENGTKYGKSGFKRVGVFLRSFFYGFFISPITVLTVSDRPTSISNLYIYPMWKLFLYAKGEFV